MNQESSVTFAALQLAEPLLRALAEKSYTHPSPIQARAIPPLLAGRDLIGCAQTGTGKTAAFALPILQRLAAQPRPRAPRRPRALILTPTRELAAQIDGNFAKYGRHLPLRHAVVFGGVGEQPQIRALAAGVEIIIATPGRLLDLMEQRHAQLDGVEIFVLDEADRMLDMGFAPDIRRIVARLPARRQSMLFSATMPEEIRQMALRLLHDPVRIDVAPVGTTVDRVEQRVCHVDKRDKHRLLVHTLARHPDGLALIFSRTKHGANRLADNLERDGVRAAAIHGNKSQGARQRALEEFRTGQTRVLVATDIAARGIDVKGITLVINFDIPNEPEAYVHRIGRTARMGAAGFAYSFCDVSERAWLRDIQRLIRQDIPVHADHPYAVSGHVAAPRPAYGSNPPPRHRVHAHPTASAPAAPAPAAAPAGARNGLRPRLGFWARRSRR
ncbi:MAG TPA: DEAD/DEAH box helicase [Opitutaceae bacterium]|nr:DEAD/DEAH box helicase [Opitutaceae bacterium]